MIQPATFRFWTMAGALTLGMVVAAEAVTARYVVGFDPQVQRCLPDTHAVVIDKTRHDLSDFRRGDLVAFRAHNMAPLFAENTTMVKVVAGLPGDVVSVAPDRTTVNGEAVGEGLDLAASLGLAPADFVRSVTVPAGALWVMGRTRDSFDSRYTGFMRAELIVGRAERLW